MSNKGRGFFPCGLKTESGRILGASGSGWCRCSYAAAFFRSGPPVFSVSRLPLREPPLRFSSRFAVRYQGQRSRRRQIMPVFFAKSYALYTLFLKVFSVVIVTLISPAEFRFFSTEFAVKSDRHDACFPRDALRRFFEVLFLEHTFIVSGQFLEVPVFRGFRSAY